jgi:hypothetical protein
MIGRFVDGLTGDGDPGDGVFAAPGAYDGGMSGTGEAGNPPANATYDRILTGGRRDLNINDL